MRVLVTGGGGFLGGVIARRLLARGDQVISYSRGRYPELEAAGAEHRRGDLSDAEGLATAAEGCEAVFHVAAKAGVGPRLADFMSANVLGTNNVIEACRRAAVPRLIHTSSPAVVFGPHDLAGADESEPYPESYLGTHYAATKAIAERAVSAANSPALRTVALRPHLIWGPGDNHLMPRIIAQARAGRLRRIGQDDQLVDATWVDDAAQAHLDAEAALRKEAPVCAGKAYFISSGDPVGCWTLINGILGAAGLPPVTKSLSPALAYRLGWLLEQLWKLGLPGEPPLTRFVAIQLSRAHWFNISAARRDLGYEPQTGAKRGLELLAEHFKATAP